MMEKNLKTIASRIKHCQICPLHGLLRGIENAFLAAVRKNAGVFKYRTSLTEEEKFLIEFWEALIEDDLAKNGFPFNKYRKDSGGSYNDGECTYSCEVAIQSNLNFAENFPHS